LANNSRLEQLKEFLKQSPEDSFLQYAMAVEYISMDQDDDAQEILEHLVKTDERYFASYYHLAKLYERKQLNSKAEQCYEAGIKMCKTLGENFAMRELQSAYDELLFD
jgi:Tfp pilus assembly protein PilF